MPAKLKYGPVVAFCGCDSFTSGDGATVIFTLCAGGGFVSMRLQDEPDLILGKDTEEDVLDESAENWRAAANGVLPLADSLAKSIFSGKDLDFFSSSRKRGLHRAEEIEELHSH